MVKTIKEERLRWVLPIVRKENESPRPNGTGYLGSVKERCSLTRIQFTLVCNIAFDNFCGNTDR